MRLNDCKMASAEPVNHRFPSRCWAGTGVMYSPANPESCHDCEMCRSSEWDLYWVKTQTFMYPALTKFDKTKSIKRYEPPKGTAGLARSAVKGKSRFPSPPARTMDRTCGWLLMGTNLFSPRYLCWTSTPALPRCLCRRAVCHPDRLGSQSCA